MWRVPGVIWRRGYWEWKMRKRGITYFRESRFSAFFFFFSFCLTPRRPRRRSRCPGSGRWVSRWWCPSRSVCTGCGGERRTAPLWNAPPPPERSSSPVGRGGGVSGGTQRHHLLYCFTEVGTHVSELPIVRIIIEFKEAFGEKLDSSQSLRRAFLKGKTFRLVC